MATLSSLLPAALLERLRGERAAARALAAALLAYPVYRLLRCFATRHWQIQHARRVGYISSGHYLLDFFCGSLPIMLSSDFRTQRHLVHMRNVAKVRAEGRCSNPNAGVYCFLTPITTNNILFFIHDRDVAVPVLKAPTDFVDRTAGVSRIMDDSMIFANATPQWHQHRRTMQPLFAPKMVKAYSPLVENVLDKMVQVLRREIDGERAVFTHNGAVNMHRVLITTTLDVIGEAGFAQQLNALDNPAAEFANAGDRLFHAIITSLVAPLSPLVRPLAEPLRRHFNLRLTEFDRARGTLERFFVPVLHQIRQRPAQDPSQGRTIIEKTAALRDPENPERRLSDQEIIGEMIGLLLAGHETTANTIVWAMYLLAENREVMAKARAEVDALEQFTSLADLPHALPYCRKAFYETLRMYATVPMLGRVATRDTYLPEVPGKTDAAAGRIFVPARAGVMLNNYAAGRNPGSWAEPEVFNPGRFDDPADPHAPSHTVVDELIAPFGGGRRKCIGYLFAELEGVALLYTLLRNFDWELDAARPPVQYTDVTLGAKQSGLWMKMTKR